MAVLYNTIKFDVNTTESQDFLVQCRNEDEPNPALLWQLFVISLFTFLSG